MNKSEQRQCVKELRASFTEDYRKKADQRITELLLQSKEYQKAKVIFVYYSTDSEPDTRKFIETALKDKKKICLPRCKGKGIMEAVSYEMGDELKETCMGIHEPGSGEVISKDSIDLAVLPCLSCDVNGNRLGHGGGYYDRFLEDFSGENICLCYAKAVMKTIETEEHDKKVGALLTEDGILYL